ncbi:nucleotidyltransferase domain-containing protein [Bacillus cereus]
MDKKIEYSRIEDEVLVLCSRKKLANKEISRVKTILNNYQIDFQYLLESSLKHKVTQLIAKHLIQLDENKKIRTYYKKLLNYHYLGNLERNKALFEEVINLLKQFNSHNIKVIPLKGTVLAPNVYGDIGLRSLNDVDFLISTDDRQTVSNILKDHGYVVGDYSWTEDHIQPINKAEELMWRMNVGNLYSHVKKIENPFLKFLIVDFSYDVDLQKNYHVSTELLKSAEKKSILGMPTYLLNDLDFFFHIAIHLYKEATNVEFVNHQADLNLIKFCDLREFLLVKRNEFDWKFVARRAKELGIEKALYFAIYYTELIYQEQLVGELLELLDIEDDSFLEYYGELDYNSPQKWNKCFSNRLFNISNKEHLSSGSKIEGHTQNIRKGD